MLGPCYQRGGAGHIAPFFPLLTEKVIILIPTRGLSSLITGRGGRPDHSYMPPWAQSINKNQDGRKSLGDDNHRLPPCKPYPYPGSTDGHRPYRYPEAVSWGQFQPSPRKNEEQFKPSFVRQPYLFLGGLHSTSPPPQQPFENLSNPYGETPSPRQPYPFPSGQQGGPSRREWGDFGEPHKAYGPWAFTQQTPWTRLPTGSDKYITEVDIFNTPGTFVIHVPLPGAKKEDIEVNWDPKRVELSITGLINRPGSEDLVKTIVLDERKVGTFHRKVRLGSRANPPKVDADAISAMLEVGGSC
ncbi:HSP20-like chaperone [Penicillium robsamsonii]|uniref:HSP20-like chaperone n=1 Tax=Penicillium robsamsonii TaxID=1792511 RepID=UPI002548C113|nr:HSP20-like chaperone [Penicillium robsamsonii]KAJ5836927.1 HSP20-like chaperone [Penicillium robsamsonii]